MMVLKHQEELSKFISQSTVANIPHSLILVGKEGCGKHTFVEDLKEHLSIECEDITDNFDDDLLNEIQCKAVPTIYVINADVLDTKKQNSLLKFFEEPSENTIIILLSTLKESIISTLLNRGRILTFKPYKKEQLLEFVGGDDASTGLSLAETPGEALSFRNTSTSFDKIKDLCDKIITKITGATLPNTMTILDKINFGNDTEKIDFNLFCKVLLMCATSYVRDNEDVQYREIYRLVSDLYNDRFIPHIDQKQLLQTFLINLKYM